MSKAEQLLSILSEKLSDGELVFLWSLKDDSHELESAKKDPKGKKMLQSLVKQKMLDKDFQITSSGERELKARYDEIRDLIGA